ncbi:MAG: hypothetical protein EBU36_04805, partial [Verrucomicrobia bacterium]|nr:hypothetical protein [Verrucomicrobiota bacterium]
MRVLLSAFYFSPYQGSEAGLGWQVARELAQRHDVTVLCGDLSPGGFVRRDLDRMKAEQSGIGRLEIHYVPPDPLTAFLHRVHTIPGLWFVYYAAYRRWQKLACWAAQKLHAERPFQVVHHLNVIGYREPGYLWMLGPPFFWGPITGASQIPWSFIRKMGITQCWRWGSRNLLNRIQMRVSLRCRRAATKAYRVWTVSGADRDMVENLWGGHAEPMLETGTGTQRPLIPRRWESGNPLRLVWSGALHGAKALPLLLEALQRVEQGLSNASFELDILGDGPAGEDWKKIPHKLGLVTPIRWHGHVDKEEALRVMNSTHVLVHTSL